MARLIIETGGKVFIIGKTYKGGLRDHRKRKCTGMCPFCFEEAIEGARFKFVKY